MIRQEQSRDRSHRMKAELSEYELACLQLLLDGCSYAEIAGRLGRTVKSVDPGPGPRQTETPPGTGRTGVSRAFSQSFVF